MTFSIIIPVYNLEKYIEDCLKSCLMQDIDNYEIICINDGSTDRSAEILDIYQTKYPEKIKVIHKKNNGVSSARNKGLETACGDWIWFVDGDDCIKRNCLGRLVKTANEQSCDIMSIQNTMFDENTTFENIMKINAPDKFEDNIECIAFKVFKANRIHQLNLKFDESLSHGEDNIFIYEFMKKFNSHYVDSNVIYFYRRRMNSASRAKTAENKRNLYKSQLHQVFFYNREIQAYDKTNCFSIDDLEFRRELFLKRALITMCLFETDKEQIKIHLDELTKEKLYPTKFNTPIQGPLKEKLYSFIQNNLDKKFFFFFIWYLKRLFQKKGY